VDVPLLVGAVVLTALVFDFTNGFHDTANAMATSIATGALKPRIAVGLSAVLNLVGAFLSIQVALTISSGIVDDTKITPPVIFGGLVGAIAWNLLTWLLGLPSSSSHALFGGLIGATWVALGANAVHFAKVVSSVLIPAVASPVIAGVVALVGTFLTYRFARRAKDSTVTRGYRVGQAVSASMVSLAHGTSDGQKTMGVITLALISGNLLPHNAHPPLWVIVCSGAAMALGTFIGGWRIIRTLGTGLTDVRSPQGFAAEASSTAVILASAHLGFALSTTHVCTGGVLGSGLGRSSADVRWGVAGKMVIAWLLTLPAAAVVGGLAGFVASSGTVGTIVVAVVGTAIGVGVYLLSRRSPVHADNVNDLPAATQAQLETAAA
jgi:PiT family inorganic phosphate transporter